MAGKKLLDGKRILMVDDEPDVLEMLGELLSMCQVVKATNFDEAKELLEAQYFDLAILDIMGVDGYRLLEIAASRNVIAVMLTAHALSVDDTVKSFKEGAASYVPKEEMSDITTYLIDILEAKDSGKSFRGRWLDRFGAYYDKKFGQDWKDKNKEFWKKFPY
ncbi:MAG: response regulator [Desulfobacteraceae bacterium]|nr:response regulator [Desulfobacteraceae bacterium]